MAADHYRLPRPVAPSPGIELGAVRPSTADAVRALLRVRAGTGWLEACVLAALWIVAVGIRLPHLWSVPAVGDDADQLVLALARSQGGAWPASGAGLLSVGALHELLFASAFAIVGPSPYLPRLVTAIQAALTVPLVYVLTRELCRPLGRRRIEEAFVMPRLAGLVAAGLLATSAAHVVVTSHVARAESFLPVLVIGLLFAVERALNGANGRWLLLAGASVRPGAPDLAAGPGDRAGAAPGGLVAGPLAAAEPLVGGGAARVRRGVRRGADDDGAGGRDPGRGDARRVAGRRRRPRPERRDVPGRGRRGAGGGLADPGRPAYQPPAGRGRALRPAGLAVRAAGDARRAGAGAARSAAAAAGGALLPGDPAVRRCRGRPAAERPSLDAGRRGRDGGDRRGGRGAGADRDRAGESPAIGARAWRWAAWCWRRSGDCGRTTTRPLPRSSVPTGCCGCREPSSTSAATTRWCCSTSGSRACDWGPAATPWRRYGTC